MLVLLLEKLWKFENEDEEENEDESENVCFRPTLTSPRLLLVSSPRLMPVPAAAPAFALTCQEWSDSMPVDAPVDAPVFIRTVMVTRVP